jgi:hypothetical protein
VQPLGEGLERSGNTIGRDPLTWGGQQSSLVGWLRVCGTTEYNNLRRRIRSILTAAVQEVCDHGRLYRGDAGWKAQLQRAGLRKCDREQRSLHASASPTGKRILLTLLIQTRFASGPDCEAHTKEQGPHHQALTLLSSVGGQARPFPSALDDRGAAVEA